MTTFSTDTGHADGSGLKTQELVWESVNEMKSAGTSSIKLAQ